MRPIAARARRRRLCYLCCCGGAVLDRTLPHIYIYIYLQALPLACAPFPKCEDHQKYNQCSCSPAPPSPNAKTTSAVALERLISGSIEEVGTLHQDNSVNRDSHIAPRKHPICMFRIVSPSELIVVDRHLKSFECTGHVLYLVLQADMRGDIKRATILEPNMVIFIGPDINCEWVWPSSRCFL